MKVVALISGGKDSFMSLDMCQQDGHQARGLSTSMRALE
jgi:diphthamide synthase (EF-2-diphthine--ammonia ligase)